MPKNGMLRVAGVADRLDFPFDSAHAEAAGDENAVDAGQDARRRPRRSTSSASIALHDHAGRLAMPA